MPLNILNSCIEGIIPHNRVNFVVLIEAPRPQIWYNKPSPQAADPGKIRGRKMNSVYACLFQ